MKIKMQPTFTADSLKRDADDFLFKMLKDKNDLITGKFRELVILAMGSFACEIVLREVGELVGELAKGE